MIQKIGKKAKAASMQLATASNEEKTAALKAAANHIRQAKSAILQANQQDMAYGNKKGLSPAMMDRLMLDEQRIEDMAAAIEAIAKLADPVHEVISSWTRPNGLRIDRVRTPIGVIAVIFESRPNVTADAGALCLKSGNSVILRSGSESLHSAVAIVQAMQAGLAEAGLCKDIIQIIPSKDRRFVSEMLQMVDTIDVIIPRGGRALIEHIQKESKIPLFMHLEGLNNSYIHKDADIDKALDVVVNAKMRRTGICGATENIVIHQEIAPTILPPLVQRLKELSCEVRGDVCAKTIVDDIIKATEDDWDTEYLDAIVSIKIVSDFHEAIAFIQNHYSHHTDAILTEDPKIAEIFLNTIDSAIVMWNTSTQFADGGEFGMGAEIGISTGKMHARGPVGVEQLTSFKYKVYGTGQTRP